MNCALRAGYVHRGLAGIGKQAVRSSRRRQRKRTTRARRRQPETSGGGGALSSFRVSRLGKAAPHKAPLASRNDADANAAAAAAAAGRQRVCFSATDRQGLEDGGRCGLLPHVTVHCVSVTVARCRYALRVPPPP